MVARIWHGIVPEEKADSYYNYLKKTGLSDYGNIEGNSGVRVLKRDDAQKTHYLLITYWDSYEAIKQFSGENYKQARYYPEDEDYLLEFEPFVKHYEVL